MKRGSKSFVRASKYCSGRLVVVVTSHHHVLLAWAEIKTKLKLKPRLITLDHHTDTSLPFRKYLKNIGTVDSDIAKQSLLLVKKIQSHIPGTVADAIELLNNDEHIVTAIQSEIIDSAFVIAHNAANTDAEIYLQHRIMCRGIESDFNKAVPTRLDCDRVLETDFLKNKIESFDSVLAKLNLPMLLSQPYILDIDLDYLNTLKSVKPKDATYLKTLATNACLVTVATEPDYVKSCAIDSELDSKLLFDELVLLIN